MPLSILLCTERGQMSPCEDESPGENLSLEASLHIRISRGPEATQDQVHENV